MSIVPRSCGRFLLSFLGSCHLVFQVTTSFYILPHSVWGFLSVHILTNPCDDGCVFLKLEPSSWLRWYFSLLLICISLMTNDVKCLSCGHYPLIHIPSLRHFLGGCYWVVVLLTWDSSPLPCMNFLSTCCSYRGNSPASNICEKLGLHN